MVKPDYGSSIDSITYNKTIEQLEKILKLLHPFTPFLSEEIWHLIDDRKTDIIVSEWPKAGNIDTTLLNDFNNIAEVIAGIRTIRKEQNIANKDQLELEVISKQTANNNLNAIITKLTNLSSIKEISGKSDNAFSFMVKSNEYFIPLGENIDVAAEIKKLQKELDYTKGFLKITEEKLANENFVKNAPQQLVEKEKKKLEDAKEKIKILAEKLSAISND